MKRKQAMREFFYFLSYAVAGFIGCAVAFFLSLQLLTPVFSEDPPGGKPPAKPEKSEEKKSFLKTIGGVSKDIKDFGRIFKDLMSESFGGKKESHSQVKPPVKTNPSPPSPDPSSPPQLEGFERPREEVGPLPEEPPPQGQEFQGGGVSPAESQVEALEEAQRGPVEETLPPQPSGAENIPGGELSGEPVENQNMAPPQEMEDRPEREFPPEPEGIQEGESQSSGGEEYKPLPPEEESAPISGSLLKLKSYMEPFLYDPSSKRRNPFEDPSQKQLEDSAQKKIPTVGRRTPLEQYPLKDIELKGIIWNVSTPKALFKLPSGQDFYTLLQGDRVGKYGVIKEIREDEVEIEETIVKGDGVEQLEEKRKKIKKMNRLKL